MKNTEVEARLSEETRDLPGRTPAADIYETEHEVIVVADLPGVDPATLDVTLENHVLSFSGRSQPAEVQGELLYSESGPAEYRRSFTLTEQLDSEKIAAKLRNGQLRITLPKVARALPRKITVAAES